MRVLTRPALFIFIFIFAATLLWGAPSEAQYRPVRPWEAGETIGALKVTELDLRHPGKTAIRDLRESLAKHPTLVYFW
ncbi:MAG: hypothetical protein KC466_03825, partial [Myxococcales bacterium]|nr:hypothetical protein [Myxococcales bacterium]